MFTHAGSTGTGNPGPAITVMEAPTSIETGTDPQSHRFESILFPAGMPEALVEGPKSVFLADLQINQIIAAAIAGREEYQLKSYFYLPLQDLATIHYRHEVFNDLCDEKLWKALEGFAHHMIEMRRDLTLAKKLRDERQGQAMVVEAAGRYCAAVSALSQDLSAAVPTSQGIRALQDYLRSYVKSPEFLEVALDAQHVRESLEKVRYCVRIKGSRVTVTREKGNSDYTADVRETFARFRQGEVKDYRTQGRTVVEMDHVEAWVLDGVTRLFPDEFSALRTFNSLHAGFQSDLVVAFDKEIQFYLAYLDLMASRAGTISPCASLK